MQTAISPACWEVGFQAWAQSTCPELSAQGLVTVTPTTGSDGRPDARVRLDRDKIRIPLATRMET